mmetsp:Transcript_103743/g.232947  ORF Transcript_103743/g.232947 Transcript_103743/m.232947 type:complete len:92 (-) Transcript_103743:9-284(-)
MEPAQRAGHRLAVTSAERPNASMPTHAHCHGGKEKCSGGADAPNHDDEGVVVACPEGSHGSHTPFLAHAVPGHMQLPHRHSAMRPALHPKT